MTETKAIDTHAHLWNEDYLDKLGKLGSQGTEVARINQSASKEDLEKRFKMMDDAGVEHISAMSSITIYIHPTGFQVR